jgi:hypothetical protein
MGKNIAVFWKTFRRKVSFPYGYSGKDLFNGHGLPYIPKKKFECPFTPVLNIPAIEGWGKANGRSVEGFYLTAYD